MSLPAISHHLRLLKAMRLVKYAQEGRWSIIPWMMSIMNLIREAQAHLAEERLIIPIDEDEERMVKDALYPDDWTVPVVRRKLKGE